MREGKVRGASLGVDSRDRVDSIVVRGLDTLADNFPLHIFLPSASHHSRAQRTASESE